MIDHAEAVLRHDLVQMAAGGVKHARTTDDLYAYQLQIYKPIIAAVDGYCMAQGAGIALCSDIRIALAGILLPAAACAALERSALAAFFTLLTALHFRGLRCCFV